MYLNNEESSVFRISLHLYICIMAMQHKVSSSGRDYLILLYLKIPENLVRFIFYDEFWVVHYYLFVGLNFNFLHSSKWTTFPIIIIIAIT